MGNDASQLKGLEINEKPTECTDFWSHYQANIRDSCRYFGLKSDGSVSVFKGESILGPLWTASTPLEKFCNNILKYRHPFIVRYISAWQQRSTFHLATEYIQPLAHVISSQTPLQKCIGLNNILQALVFLHEQGKVSHNNISTSAIYVSGDGQWKLGGLQYLCNFSEQTPAYLKQSRIHRYDKAVDPNEDTNEPTTKVDQYAFAVLVEDIFKGCKDDEVPYLKEFKKFCRERLQSPDCKQRPSLSEVMQHDFFNHEFISVYKFLSFLPLKCNEEKTDFFSNILQCLKCYDEETVAKQFGGLLLSRLTLLDQTARKDVIPYILKPRNDRTQNGEHCGFFTLGVFKEHLKPRIIQLFSVRDGQIRMLLLAHFSKYVHVFSHDELSQHILPELLLGIKDTDDALVSATLVCLSELVPILGADTVVGGKRSRLFTDGRPNSNAKVLSLVKNGKANLIETHVQAKSLQDFQCSESIYTQNIATSVFEQALPLNERPSPVGSESMDIEIIPVKPTYQAAVESEDDWDDWDNSNHKLRIEDPGNSHIDGTLLEAITLPQTSDKKLSQEFIETESHAEGSLEHSILLQKAALEAKKNIIDISELDIKNKIDQSKKGSDEFDFFADMTPVIEKQKVAPVREESEVGDYSSKLNFVPNNEMDENEGWGDTWND
ncbi:protein-associating with the carboxyl-terminal domain of ezrin [Zerene cesonia]|uniref:protein-associating with the carboxyl-terminal domain of ezrin n=1 Tax=Zerene cesonia TaxID=33412 RepID=UPI0018E59083|nr:protein-associating with the carboxyl-terminal domain of ezrin [Zerene cesonia]